MINEELQQVATRVNALGLRDRSLILIAAVVLLFLIADRVGFQPLYDSKQSLITGIEAQEIELQVLRAQIGGFSVQTSEEQRSPLADLRNELNAHGRRLQSRLDSLLSPDRAADILQEVLVDEQGLALVSVNTRVTPMVNGDGRAGTESLIDNLNRYELDLTLAGGFMDTLHYLRELESLPWKFFWTGISFIVTDYPKARVELQIYTLGRSGD